MGRRNFHYGHLNCIRSGELDSEGLATLYSLMEDAIEATKVDGRSTTDIFGEIYTRFRTEAKHNPDFDSVKVLCKGKLKDHNWSKAGHQMSGVINQLFAEKMEREPDMLDLELCHIIAQSCIEDAKDVVTQSEAVVSKIEKIDRKLKGESNE